MAANAKAVCRERVTAFFEVQVFPLGWSRSLERCSGLRKELLKRWDQRGGGQGILFLAWTLGRFGQGSGG